MNKKRVAVIVVLIIVTIIVGVIWEQLSQKKITVPPTVVTENPAFPPPAYTTQPEYRVGAIVSFPESVPSYAEVGSPSARLLASSLVASLGVAGTPEEIQSTGGNVYVWSANNKSVIASEGLSHIAYSGAGGASGPLNEPLESYYSAAEQFISLFNLAKPPIQLARVAPRYFNPSRGDANEVASASGATNIQLDFQYSVNNIPVYLGTAAVPSVSVRLDAKGEILTVSAFILPSFVKGNANVPLLSSQEANARLVKGEGRITDLVSSDVGDELYYFDAPPTIVDVVNVDLAYYYSPQQKNLVPVYAFRGIGKINNKSVNTTTLLSAVK